jgi:putative tryptophan/tyrosine transport system substrate-binding protein
MSVRRREFISGLILAVACWPRAAGAQQTGKLPTIGFLATSTPTAFAPWIAAFTRRLSELGWNEGRTVAIEYRFAEGQSERYAEMAAEFVRLKVDVIVTTGAAALAAKQATSSIPIVFAVAQDPLGSGLISNLAHPGENLTGSSLEAGDLAGKRVEFLRAVVPSLHRLAVIGNSVYPGAVEEMNDVEAVARQLGIETMTFGIKQAADITSAFGAFKGRADALYVIADPLTNENRVRINILAVGARLPTMLGFREPVEAGGLMSYGPNFQDLFRRAADYVDKILRGAKPADLPVEQPTKFELIVNLTTAKAIGLTIPESFLSFADKVIE